jgi:phage terminase large subunit
MSATAPSVAELSASRNAFAVLLQRYARQPVAFVREVLGAEPDPWQRDVLTALGRGHTRISIRSGHGVGKSTTLAWTMIWFLLTRFPCKTVVTAPSAPQLFDALWSDMRSWLQRLPDAWLMLLDIQSDHVSLKARPDDAFISARTSRAETPDSLQGVHSKHVLLVIDEAAGVPEPVFEAAGGSMSTVGAITIMAGNPTRTVGTFWRSHTLDKDRWFTLKVPALGNPRVGPQYPEEIAARYGTDSNQYRIRVLGEFPLAEGDTLIPAVLVEDAMRREATIDAVAPLIWGLDVARFGTDASCLIKRQGTAIIEPPRRWTGFDGMQLTGAIVAEFKRTSENPPQAIVVDAIGLGGPVADRLRELRLPAIDVNVSESPSSEGRFVRLRDELWQSVRDWFDNRTVSLPWDDQLRDDLCAPRYGFSSDGKLRVESKDQLRSRGIPSPDSADALCLSFAPAAYIAAAYGVSRLSQPLRRNIRGVL